jgi:hypothetical protein
VKLTLVHQILIVAAIALGCIYAVRAVWLVASGGGAGHVPGAVVAVAFAAVALWYLRRFRQKLAQRDDKAR